MMVFRKKEKKRKPASNEMLTGKLIELENRFNKLVTILQEHCPALKLYFAEEQLKVQSYVKQQTTMRPVPLQKTVPAGEAIELIKEGKTSEEAKQVLKI